MNAANLRELLVRHNRLALWRTIALTCSSILLWWLSYFIASWLTAVFFRLWLPRDLPSWIQPSVVGFVMLLLLGEIFRQRAGLFDLAEFYEWGYIIDTSHDELPVLVGLYPRHPVGSAKAASWMVSQTLLLAPHTTMLAWRNWKSRVEPEENVLTSAVELYHSLAKTRDWVLLTDDGRRAELGYLGRAGLLWSRREGNLLEVQTFRYEPPSSWWPVKTNTKRKRVNPTRRVPTDRQ